MMQVMRDGYWCDVAVHLLVVVLLGSAFAWGLAWAVDTFFGDAVTQVVGEAGEYDVLIQIRTEQKEAALTELKGLIAQQLPGAELKQGVSIAGQTAYFLRIPDSIRTAATFEGLEGLFHSVPGFIGHTLMVEPSVSVSGLHAALVGEVQRAAEQLPEVAFTFQHGDKLVAVLHRPGDVGVVQESLRAVLNRYELFEVRPKIGDSLSDPQVTGDQIEQVLRKAWGPDSVHKVHWSGRDAQTDTFVTTLTEMRHFLLSYATHIYVPGAADYVGQRLLLLPDVDDDLGPVEVQMEGTTDEGAWGFVVSGAIEGRNGPWSAYQWQSGGQAGAWIGSATLRNQRTELAAALAESVELLSSLSDFAADAEVSMAESEALLGAFNEAVGRLASLDQQIKQLEKGLAGSGNGAEATPAQALLGVLVTSWLNRLSGGAPTPVTEEVEQQLLHLDLTAIGESLQMLSAGVTDLAELNVDAVIQGIEQMQRTLPLFTDEEIAQSVQLIDKNLAGGVVGERLTVLARPGVAVDSAEAALAAELGMDGVRLVPTAGGVLAPNARAALAQILGQVRELVAALCTLVIVLLVLLLDYSVLFSMERMAASGRQGTQRGWRLLGYGAATGALMTGLIALLSGAELPLVGWPGVVALGAGLGLGSALLASRINPIDSDEVVAGIALGLSHRQVMREIVVPTARPGLFVVMNRWHQVF